MHLHPNDESWRLIGRTMQAMAGKNLWRLTASTAARSRCQPSPAVRRLAPKDTMARALVVALLVLVVAGACRPPFALPPPPPRTSPVATSAETLIVPGDRIGTLRLAMKLTEVVGQLGPATTEDDNRVYPGPRATIGTRSACGSSPTGRAETSSRSLFIRRGSRIRGPSTRRSTACASG